MIGAGTYTAVAADVQFGKSSKGTEHVAVQFRVTEGDSVGQSITWFGYLSEKTWERTFQGLRYCGWKGDDISNMGELDQVVEIVLEDDEYEGKTTTKVKWVNRIGAGRVKLNNPMDDSEVRLFAARMKSKAAGVAEHQGEKATEVPAQAGGSGDGPPPQGDDDIPFASVDELCMTAHQPGSRAV